MPGAITPGEDLLKSFVPKLLENDGGLSRRFDSAQRKVENKSKRRNPDPWKFIGKSLKCARGQYNLLELSL